MLKKIFLYQPLATFHLENLLIFKDSNSATLSYPKHAFSFFFSLEHDWQLHMDIYLYAYGT